MSYAQRERRDLAWTSRSTLGIFAPITIVTVRVPAFPSPHIIHALWPVCFAAQHASKQQSRIHYRFDNMAAKPGKPQT